MIGILILFIIAAALSGDRFAIGIVGIIVIIYVVRALLLKIMDLIYDFDEKLGVHNNPRPPRYDDPEDSHRQKEGESIYHWTKRLQNDIVDDDFGNEAFISSDRESVCDEYGNKLYDIDEMNEVYIKDTNGHYRTRNKYK